MGDSDGDSVVEFDTKGETCLRIVSVAGRMMDLAEAVAECLDLRRLCEVFLCLVVIIPLMFAFVFCLAIWLAGDAKLGICVATLELLATAVMMGLVILYDHLKSWIWSPANLESAASSPEERSTVASSRQRGLFFIFAVAFLLWAAGLVGLLDWLKTRIFPSVEIGESALFWLWSLSLIPFLSLVVLSLTTLIVVNLFWVERQTTTKKSPLNL